MIPGVDKGGGGRKANDLLFYKTGGPEENQALNLWNTMRRRHLLVVSGSARGGRPVGKWLVAT